MFLATFILDPRTFILNSRTRKGCCLVTCTTHPMDAETKSHLENKIYGYNGG
jgi:hypothetical protein